ncbi:hypothetical protein Fmac_028751 [Flemingia macrophylla]|uniref:Uncharacterized protein n=1 Tax=Flemingia macrophylla TaxID=520843 RepID=A0ABD1L8D6_9FABA
MATPQDDHKPQPLVIRINKEEGPIAPLRILAPRPFLYVFNKAVPWRYETHTSLDEDISNIAGIGGMTRSGRVYSPKNMQDKAPKGKEKEKIEEKEEESKDETDELLKFIRQKPHRKALLKVLNEAYVPHGISQDKFEGIVAHILAKSGYHLSQRRSKYSQGVSELPIVKSNPMRRGLGYDPTKGQASSSKGKFPHQSLNQMFKKGEFQTPGAPVVIKCSLPASNLCKLNDCLRHGTIDDLAHLASAPTISPSAIAPAGNQTRDLALIPIVGSSAYH